jgi:glutamate/tyrosine decarboxylase-like PLP-dependent enzyme
MRDRIRKLEQISRRLDPDAESRRSMHDAVRDYAEQFLNALPETDTYVKDVGRQGLANKPITEDAAGIHDLLELYRREVDTTGILPASGGQLGYIPGGGLFPSALGDLLAGISNRYSGVSFAGPGAADMEGALVRWMCELAGYPESGGGDLTSGGSLATLSALVTARDAKGIDHERIPDACVYLTAQAHHCVSTALHVAGLGGVPRRIVPMDSHFRMDTARLREMIAEDRQKGLTPWLVVASAGTTDTGAVDPIPAVAAVCEENDLWFHLDAAYGGFFRLCEEGSEKLDGMELADSIVMDPHKGLGLPYGCGAVLLRDRRLLARSFSYYADYMQDAIREDRELAADHSPADFSPELTRPFRGPRMWFPLKLFGLAPFRASLAEKIWLARYFYEEIGKLKRFEAGPRPDLSIVTFRLRSASGDANEINRKLLQAVHDDGRVFITSTLIDGNFTLRLAVLNFRTHLEQVDYLLELLDRKSSELAANP